MNVKHLPYWNFDYIEVDGETFGPISKADAEMAMRRGGQATKTQMISFLKEARISSNVNK